MTKQEELEKFIGSKDVAKHFLAQMQAYMDYLQLPYRGINDVVDGILENERVKIEFVKKIGRCGISLAGKRVLDVGCGKGGVVLACAREGAQVTGFDVDNEELRIAIERMRCEELEDRITLLQGDAHEIAFSDNSFDIVISTSTLEHVVNPKRVLREMVRVTKHQGLCIISMPNPLYPREGHYRVVWIPFLPKQIGKILLRLMGRNPKFFERDVHYFSVGQAIQTLRKERCEVKNISESAIREKILDPQELRYPPYRKIFSLGRVLGVSSFLVYLVTRFSLYPTAFIVARKFASPQSSKDSFLDYDTIDAALYDTRHQRLPKEAYLRKHWEPLFHKAIATYCKGKDVLDLGCGTGAYIPLIIPYARRIVGVDRSQNLLNLAKQKYPQTEFQVADAHHIPFPSHSFDVVIVIGLFEYVNKEKVIREISRVLRDSGIGIFAVPNKYSFSHIVSHVGHKVLGRPYKRREYSVGEMRKLFKENGFEIVDYTMDDGLIWLPNVIDRLSGEAPYRVVEGFFKVFRKNPFSSSMLFIVEKQKS